VRTAAPIVALLGILVLSVVVLPVEGFSLTPNGRQLAIATAQRLSLVARWSTTATTTATRTAASSSTLSMHMGHSHSHHHHHSPTVEKEEALTPKQSRRKKRRRFAAIAFAAFATLGVKLASRRPIDKTDLLAFGLTSALVVLSDKIRRSVKRTFQKMRNFRDGIVRHSTPPKEWLQSVFGVDSSGNAEADQVTLFGGLINLVLSAAKLSVGVACHSAALIADAGHSLSDLFSDVITLWAVQLGRLPPDEDHPYGHGKFEAIGSLFLALTLLGTGVSVGASSNKKLLEILALQHSMGWKALAGSAQIPGRPALLVALISILSKEWLYRITRQVGEKLNSQVVIANAWHHRSDAYSSVLALFAIGLAIYFPSLVAADAAAGMLVAGMICMTGAEILGESIKQLTDTTNQRLVKKVRMMAETYSRAQESKYDLEVKRVRARQVGSLALVDVDIGIPGALSSAVSNQISTKLRQKLMHDFADSVLDIEVHATTQDDQSLAANGIRASSGDGVDGYTEGEPATIIPPSPSDIEAQVRNVISLKKSDVINRIESVSVKYDFLDESGNGDAFNDDAGNIHDGNEMMANVDVMISVVDPEIATVAAANDVAQQLRDSIEELEPIRKANIFLDLNTPILRSAATT